LRDRAEPDRLLNGSVEPRDATMQFSLLLRRPVQDGLRYAGPCGCHGLPVPACDHIQIASSLEQLLETKQKPEHSMTRQSALPPRWLGLRASHQTFVTPILSQHGIYPNSHLNRCH
jgi:hypothetical protein